MGQRRVRWGFTTAKYLLAVLLAGAVVMGALNSTSERVIQTRNARARANLAVVARGLGAYQIDWGIYPYDGIDYKHGSGWHHYDRHFLPIELTTPVAHSDPRYWVDPHRVAASGSIYAPHCQWGEIRYTNWQSTAGDLYSQLQYHTGSSMYLDEVLEEWGEWLAFSSGPDTHYGQTGWHGISGYPGAPIPYDPTNGIQSEGDILRSQLSPVGYLNIPQSTEW